MGSSTGGCSACSVASLEEELESSPPEVLEVSVSTLSGEVVGELTMPRTAVVAQLKHWLSERDTTRTPVSRLCLLSGQKIVSDADVLKDLLAPGWQGKLALHLVRKQRKMVGATLGPLQEQGLLFKMVLVGDTGVGKASIVRRLTKNTFWDQPHDPRFDELMMCSAADVLVDDVTRVKLQMWPTNCNVQRMHLHETKCVFVVFDMASRDSFDHLPEYLGNVERCKPPEALVSIIGNKADLVEEQEVSADEAMAFATKLGLACYIVSAKTGHNSEAPFYDQCSVLLDRAENAKG